MAYCRGRREGEDIDNLGEIRESGKIKENRRIPVFEKIEKGKTPHSIVLHSVMERAPAERSGVCRL